MNARHAVIPDWNVLFGDLRAAQVAIWLVAIALLIGVLIRLWPFIKNAVAIVDALVALPTLTKQIAAIQTQIDGIHHETHKNDGSSIKDAVGRVEEGVAGLHGRMDDVDRQLTALAREDEALWRELDHTSEPDQNDPREDNS